MVGGVGIGGDNPIRLQSMNNTNTLHTEESALQAKRIADAGGEIVRLTTQGMREAENMAAIKARLHELGCDVPLVADVHFNPKAAYTAAATTDKVRINPGNFVDAARTFVKLEFSDAEYADEIDKIRKALIPFLHICREHHTAVRLGVNHGSLSDRIMSRYGDTPAGMVESVMEFLRICREADFSDIVISIKASNTTIMVETVKLLADAMEREDMHFPLHLGVTEAGDGEDGRIKSAVGTGALLALGYGDTIRISLSEDPELEIPVAARLRDYIAARQGHSHIAEPDNEPQGISREKSVRPEGFGKNFLAGGTDFKTIPSGWHIAQASDEIGTFGDEQPVVLSSDHINRPGEMMSWTDRFQATGARNPIILRLRYDTDNLEELQVEAGADAGALLLSGYGSGLIVEAPAFADEIVKNITLGILQAARLRMTKTEYISCPSCGRTLFDLQSTLKEVKAATGHLKGLKIGVMGCIVNGPGEMADVDYGYVGAGVGRVSIYKGKELVKKNITREEALEALITLIKDSDDWTEPSETTQKEQ